MSKLLSNRRRYFLNVLFLVIMGFLTFFSDKETNTENDNANKKHRKIKFREEKTVSKAMSADLTSYRSVCDRIFGGRQPDERNCIHSFIKHGYVNYRRIASFVGTGNIGGYGDDKTTEGYRAFFIIKEVWSRDNGRSCIAHNIHFLDARNRPGRVPDVRFRTCFPRIAKSNVPGGR